MRVIIANPPGFGGPDYDHHLCSELAAQGADVELVTTRFRFGAMPEPDGYRRSLLFYPVSARLFGRSRLRVPVKVAEHPFGMAGLALRRPDVLHVQWLSIPELDRWLLRSRAPLVYTAHDHAQRRTAGKAAVWEKLYERFRRVVAHSESGRLALAEQGIPEHKLRVIPHPIIRSDPARSDDGRTLLCFGLIRPYKGIDDAIEVTRAVEGARLLVAGDPMEPVEGYQRRAGALAEWRLGYLPQAEVDRAYGDATLAIFPYKPGSTSRARCFGRWARACRRSPTTSAAWARTCAGSAPAGWCPSATSTRWRRRCASCWTIRPRWPRRGRARCGRATR